MRRICDLILSDAESECNSVQAVVVDNGVHVDLSSLFGEECEEEKKL